VQRSEEEVRVGTRGREAGAVKVRKSVRTEREQVRVPKRREEIDIERVPGTVGRPPRPRSVRKR
jgi:stress response protein YsnF